MPQKTINISLGDGYDENDNLIINNTFDINILKYDYITKENLIIKDIKSVSDINQNEDKDDIIYLIKGKLINKNNEFSELYNNPIYLNDTGFIQINSYDKEEFELFNFQIPYDLKDISPISKIINNSVINSIENNYINMDEYIESKWLFFGSTRFSIIQTDKIMIELQIRQIFDLSNNPLTAYDLYEKNYALAGIKIFYF
jgi:hypothetical protein